jgi:hypothetical protein
MEKAGKLTAMSAVTKNDCAHEQDSASNRKAICVKRGGRRSLEKKLDCSDASVHETDGRLVVSDGAKQRLDDELKMLQIHAGMGSGVTVEWQPGVADYDTDEGKLAEIVRGNTIFVFSSSLGDAIKLVRHGFLEWILNQHARLNLRLINQLISLYEQQQYERKEKTIDALLKMLQHVQTPHASNEADGKRQDTGNVENGGERTENVLATSGERTKNA